MCRLQKTIYEKKRRYFENPTGEKTRTMTHGIDKLNNDVIMNLVDKMIKNKQIDCFAQIGGYILPFICF
jgi:hypothetical protein